MTILTKVQGGEKKENDENLKKEGAFIPVVSVEGKGSRPGSGRSLAWSESGDGGSDLEWYLVWRRRRMLTSLCVVLLVLWLLLAAVIGGILVYRHLHARRPVYYGWCGTRYTERGRDGRPRAAKLQERVEVDLDKDYEKIEVPQIGDNRPAIFIHDFAKNLTAIVDLLENHCFVKPLDRSEVAPPKSLIDLMEIMEKDYSQQNSEVVREEFRVRTPPLSLKELLQLHSFTIFSHCGQRTTFMLDPVDLQVDPPRPIRIVDKRRARRATKGVCKEYHVFQQENTVNSISLC